MSLTVKGSSEKSFSLLPEGSYTAVCYMLADLGMQYNEMFDKNQRKVLIGWEIAGETIEIDGAPVPRTVFQRYTASLGDRSILRKDLASWRSRDFTADELAAFDLKNIIGVPCLLQIIHNKVGDKEYANISSIMSLPKGMPKPELVSEPVIYDIDESDPADVEKLPEWIKNIIVKSESYQERISGGKFSEMDVDDGELPF